MLRRLSSATSFSSILRSNSIPAATNDGDASPTASVHSPSLTSRSRSLSLASSALAEAFEEVIPGTTSNPDQDATSTDDNQTWRQQQIKQQRRLKMANNQLVATLEQLQDAKGAKLDQRLQLLAQVQIILTDQPETRDTFRQHGGFLNCVSVIATLDAHSIDNDHNTAEGDGNSGTIDEMLPFELVQLVFAVLALTMDGYDVNRAEFNDNIGFEAIGEALKLSGVLRKEPRTRQRPTSSANLEGEQDETKTNERLRQPPSRVERIFSTLYSFLVNDFSSSPLFTTLRQQLIVLDDSTPQGLPRPTTFQRIEVLLQQRQDLFAEIGGQVATFVEIVPFMLDLLDQVTGSQTVDKVDQVPSSDGNNDNDTDGGDDVDNQDSVLRLMVLSSLRQLCHGSRRNLIGLHQIGMLKLATDRLFPASSPPKQFDQQELQQQARRQEPTADEREIWFDVLSKLLELGASPTDVRTLCQRAVKGWQDQESDESRLDQEVLKVILDGVCQSRLPSFINFDMSSTGYSSMTLPCLGKPFPPQTHGYAFIAWLSIDQGPLPNQDPLVVFSCSDKTAKTFVEVSITSDLSLAFTTTSTRSGLIVFDSFTLKLGQWYHVAIVHQRPRISLTSTVTLYIDGQAVDVNRAAYPSSTSNSTVRAWFGNPKHEEHQNSSTVQSHHHELNKGTNQVKWNLGSTWLIHGDIPEEMVYVCWSLGPRYSGNFQDQLGQFQTNSSSTDLNVRLDALTRSSRAGSSGGGSTRSLPSNSPLVFAVRDRGSAVIPEHRIFFSLSSVNFVSSSSVIQDYGLAGTGLSTTSKQQLNSILTKDGPNQFIVNSALPGKPLLDVLQLPQGKALIDQAFVSLTQPLDEVIWTIGGVGVVLRLIELSQSESDLEMGVQLFIQVISRSWRNSEDAERIQAYETLAMLLKSKAPYISLQVYNSLIEFCGFDLQDEHGSIVSNVLGFRYIILDFSLWADVNVELQQMHLLRLKQLLQLSDCPEFNLRRLTKMHIVRKLLFALRANLIDASLTNEMVDLLMELVKSNFTTDTVRHIATFLTATLCQTIQAPPLMTPATPGQGEIDLGYIDPVDNSDNSTGTRFILDARLLKYSQQVKAPLRVLAGLHDFLLESDSLGELQKFARIITTKWILLFLLDRRAPPLAAVYAFRILVRLLQTQGSNYVTKFTNSMDGFAVLRGTVPHLWYCAQIDLALFALLHDHDVSMLSLSSSFDKMTFMQSCSETSTMAQDVVRIIVACLGRGLKVIEKTEAAQAVNELDKDVSNGRAETKEDHGDSDAVTVNGPDEDDRNAGSTTLLEGFETLIDMFSQSHSASAGSRILVMSPVALADIVSALRPSLRLPPNAMVASNSSKPPLLPVMSVHTGFQPGAVSSANDLSDPLGLGVATARIVVEPSSPTTSRRGSAFTSNDSSKTANDPSLVISDAADALLGFLSQRVIHDIVTRKTRKRSLTANYEAQLSPNADTSLNLLRDMFDASASQDVQAQVTFCTLLVNDICKRLTRAGTSPLVAQRVGEFFAMATDLAVEGWNADIVTMVEHVTAYIEKLLHDSLLGSHEKHGKTLDILYQSLNRLILILLASDDEKLVGVCIPTLIRHQLTIFADPNDYSEFVQCLCYRLYTLARNSTDPGPIVNLFKLFILGRPEQIEFVLGEKKRKGFEAPFADRLVDNNVEGFIAVLKEYDHRLQQLKETWNAFIDGELGQARPALDKDLSRMSELATAHRTRREVHRKRVRRQRAATSEWSEGIHEVEATRVAHARQDMNDHSSSIQAEWAKRLQSFVDERGIWSRFDREDQWQLDFTEGHNRMRKKLLRVHSLSKSGQNGSANGVALVQNADRQTRSLGGSRNDKLGADDRRLEVESSPSPTTSPMLPQEEMIWKDRLNGDVVLVEQEPTDVSGEPSAGNDTNAEEDKNRKVRRSLETGDVIESVFNVSRIVGMDAIAGLLLLAKKNVYIIDGFFQTSSGEIVNAWDAPSEERDQHLQTLAELAGRSSKPASESVPAMHQSRRWAWPDLLEVHERKYLFRNVALELFFADGQSFLLTFHKDRRANALSILAARNSAAVAFGSLSVAGTGVGGKFADILRGQRSKLEQMTRRWEQRLVSNFEYLTFLNTISGRTYNDLTNYPVFPWIIADYDSEELDLNSPNTFRDLSKPMGAQSENRRHEFEERFQQLSEMEDETKPFHYGTHYSSAMIVVGYLVRLKPFTESYLDLQGGSFDHADRMFWSISKAWESCSKTNRSDVRELIPEFFYLPDFLTNPDGLDLGTRQEDGSAIDNVVLPRWAKGDTRLFVELHRQALESDYVSAHLHEWIDLIFGFKSGTGPAAIASVNVYHHLSYEGAIDLDSIENAIERKAATSTIHNFGMTPKQLFTKPHVARPARLIPKGTRPLFSPDLTIEQQAVVLVQSIVPVCVDPNGRPVSTIYNFGQPEKTIACSNQTILIPNDSNHVVSWFSMDQTVRIHPRSLSNSSTSISPSSTLNTSFVTSTMTTTSLFENMHAGHVSCAVFADSKTFVTGSTDTTVCLWRCYWKSGSSSSSSSSSSTTAVFQQIESLRGHEKRVICVAASRAFSIVVSGSSDQTAIVWDLNRRKFVHHLTGHEASVHLVAICDTTGDIATCSGAVIRLWTVNGDLLTMQSTSNFNDPITSVAFSKSETNPIIATGHRDGQIKLWRRDPVTIGSGLSGSKWQLTLLHTLYHRDRVTSSSTNTSRQHHGSTSLNEITALTFTNRTLYSGDSQGRCYLWSPPGTELVLNDSINAGLCMGCSSKFGLMETRRRCSSCAGVFCSMCTTTNVEAGGRFCGPCLKHLSPFLVLEQNEHVQS
ncbi:beige protein-like 1 [Microbotryomycetes sp. JL221]|nr:beige protein-like 1 [Microbotryomycetes sp. JL221]